jgi:cyclophilin family peptidyl-prolyl cis-trans isomerase
LAWSGSRARREGIIHERRVPRSMAGAPPPTNPANPRVKIQTTAGDVVVELFQTEAPVSTKNFLEYVNSGFYEGLIFHRVIKGFMIQGGGLDAGGKQKKGRSPIKLEINYPTLQHWDGALCMARTSDPNSATSQFYICHGAQAGLDKNYAVFGVVREGRAVVDKIATTPTDRSDKPKTDVAIEKMSVV